MSEEKGWIRLPKRRGKGGGDKTEIALFQTPSLSSTMRMFVVVNINNIRGEPSGQTVIISTSSSERVDVFKHKIEEKAARPTHVDCISHESIKMEAHLTMGDYGIRHGSCIVCTPFFTMEELAEARGWPLPKKSK